MLGEIAAAAAPTDAPDDWLAGYADALMSDYGLTLHEAVWTFPLAAAMALAPSRIRRHGGKWDRPGSGDRAVSEARARCKAWLALRFRVLPPGEPGPEDALGEWLRGR